jgi:hypothetical protein
MKLKQILEQAQAKYGNWKEDIVITSISEFIINNKYKEIGSLQAKNKSFEIFELISGLDIRSFVIGYWDTKVEQSKSGAIESNTFNTVCKATLTKDTHGLTYPNLYIMESIEVATTMQGETIAISFYKFLLATDITIIGDTEQYFGARKLWSKLSKSIDVKIDIVDTNTKDVLEQNVILHQGDYDHDFDERLWSYDIDKLHLRSVLRRITS